MRSLDLGLLLKRGLQLDTAADHHGNNREQLAFRH